MFCPNHAHNRLRLFEVAGTNRYQEILLTWKDPLAVARWVMSEGLLPQFSLAKEQIDCVESRARGNDDEGNDSADEEDSERE